MYIFLSYFSARCSACFCTHALQHSVAVQHSVTASMLCCCFCCCKQHGCNLFRNCKHAASRNSANNNNTTPAASRSACSSFSSFSSCSVIVCCSMPLFLLLWLHRCIHFPGCSGTTTACIIVVASSIPEQHAAFPHFLFSLPIV